jgi:predicted transcriptional regulator
MPEIKKQNVTISLSTQLIQKVKILAAKRSTSISGLLAAQVEALVNEDDHYERAAASAIARMERGLHLGGGRMVSRDELHAR